MAFGTAKARIGVDGGIACPDDERAARFPQAPRRVSAGTHFRV